MGKPNEPKDKSFHAAAGASTTSLPTLRAYFRLEGSFAVVACLLGAILANLLATKTSVLKFEHIVCNGKPTTALAGIPRKVHQIWIQGDPPSNYRSFRSSWMEKHGQGWEMKLWNGEQLTELIGREMPQLLPLYSRIENPAHKSDLGRYVILYLEGGLYADLDIESYHSFAPLLEGRSMLLFQEPAAHWENVAGKGDGKSTAEGKLISNSLIASVPAHPLLQEVIRCFQEQFQLVQVCCN
jgi:mannosyltransferase OCH1-like enzyme